MGIYTPDAAYGRALLNSVAAQVPTFGRILVVMNSSDNQSQNYLTMSSVFKTDPDGKIRFFTSLEDAYAAAESNNNDVIVLDGHSTHSVAAGIAWTKNRVHVMGFDGGGRYVQQGAKIELTGAVDSAYVIKVTGVRNSFRNIKFIQSSTHANALNVLQLAGEGTYMEHCSAVFGVADNMASTSLCEVLMGEDSGTFVECSFGTDVLLSTGSTGRSVMTLDAITGGSADGAKSNRFIHCEWLIMSSSANALLIKLADTGGAKFLNEFLEPRLLAIISSGGGGIAITNAIASASSFVDGSLHFIRPVTNGCTNGCAGVTDHVTISGAPVFTSNAWEGGTPA